MNKTTPWSKLHGVASTAEAKLKLKNLAGTVKGLEEELAAERERGKFKSRLANVPIAPIKEKSQKASQSVAFAVASDWHSDEGVEADTVNGVNEFNQSIARQRIDRFATGIVKLTDTQRNATDIDTLVMPYLGDFISGHIHDDLIEITDLSPTQAARRVKGQLLGVIEYLRSKGNFKRIIIPCHYGNHGRTTHKMRIATAYMHSYEYVLYEDLAEMIQRLGWSDVEIKVNKAYYSHLDVYGSTIRCHHGDAIKYGGGVGGITIPVNKAIAQWDKLRQADFDVFGHFHQFTAHRKFICNGSLIGYNAFALRIKADAEPAQQAYFLWEAKRGRTITAPIIVQ